MSRVLAAIGAAQILIMLVALVRAKVLSVLLGPANYGVVSTVDQTVQSLAQLCALGLPFTAMKFMARRHSEDHSLFERTYATFFRTVAGLAILAALAVGVLLAGNPGLFGRDLAAYRSYFLVALVGVPAVMLNIFFVNTLASAQRGAASASLNLIVLLALTVAAVSGVLAHGIGGLYPATVATGFLTTGGTIWYLRRSLGVHITVPTAGILTELRESPQVVSYALLIYAALSAYSLTILATRYFVFAELGAVSAGLLQALLSISLTVSAVMTTMNNLYFIPYINRAMPVAQKVAAANGFARKMIVLLVLTGVSVALFPKLAVTVLFSAKFADGAEVLYLFVAWQCLLQTVNVYLQLLIGLDDVAFYSLTTCVGYGCAALVFAPLVARFGLGGAAMALAVAMVVAAIAITVRLRMKFGTGVDGTTGLRAVYCVLAVAGAGLVFRVASEGTLAGIAARAGYLLLVLAVLWLTFSGEERDMLIAGMAWGRRQGARLRLPFA